MLTPSHKRPSTPTEELEERLEDEESERASLVSRSSRRSRLSLSSSVKHSRRTPSGAGVLSRLFGRSHRASYEPIRAGDE